MSFTEDVGYLYVYCMYFMFCLFCRYSDDTISTVETLDSDEKIDLELIVALIRHIVQSEEVSSTVWLVLGLFLEVASFTQVKKRKGI